jgi:Na+/phosphate symporter
MLEECAAAIADRDPEHYTRIARSGNDLATLEAAILHYLGRLRQGLLSERDSAEVQQVMEAVLSFESLGQLAARDLLDVAKQTGRLRPSAETAEMLRGLYDTARGATALAVRAAAEADRAAAGEVVALRARVDEQVRELLERQASRLRPDDPDYLTLARLQMTIVDKLGRVYELASRVARGVLAASAERAAA